MNTPNPLDSKTDISRSSTLEADDPDFSYPDSLEAGAFVLPAPSTSNSTTSTPWVDACPLGSLLADRNSRLRFGPSQLYATALVTLDIVALVTCLFVAHFLRHAEPLGASPLLSLCIPLAGMLALLYLIDGYQPRTDFLSAGYAAQHTIAVGMAALVTLFAVFVIFPDWGKIMPRRTTLCGAFLLFFLVSILYRRKMYGSISKKLGQSFLLFLGDDDRAQQFYEDYSQTHLRKTVLFATESGLSSVVSSGEDEDALVESEFLNQDLFQRLRGRFAGVICAHNPDYYEPGILREIMNLRLSSVPIFSFNSFYESRLRKIPLTSIKPAWLLKEGFRIAHDPIYANAKRMMDIMVSATALILVSPLLAAVALCVRLTDGGPVFFRQARIGLNKRTFDIVKFRTMTVGSEKGNLYTEVNDSRLTRIGGRLRKWRLDELPQLWNVFRGDMSLIGPRPEWDRLVAGYERKVPCYHFRHLVKPGITGWAQVNYPYGANLHDTKRKLEYDLYYIRHFSFLLDASIVLKTLNTMIFGKGQ